MALRGTILPVVDKPASSCQLCALAHSGLTSLFCGLDLGQIADYTATCIVRRTDLAVCRCECHGDAPLAGGKARYDVVHLARWRGRPYPELVDEVARLLRTPQLRGKCQLVVDATGVGRAVVDMFQVCGVGLCAVTITGGNAESGSWPEFSVPKRDLVGALVAVSQGKRLRIASSLPDAAALSQEMLNFKVKIDARTAHDSYAAWRDGQHDDLVLSLAMAIWLAERFGGIGVARMAEPEVGTHWIGGVAPPPGTWT